MEDKKKFWLYYNDIVRFLAIIGVLFIHTTAYAWSSQEVGTFNWNILSVYNCLGRIGVPLFVMISGAIWLNPNKEFDFLKLVKKNIKKLVIAFLSWTWIYSIAYMIGMGFKFDVDGIRIFIEQCLVGHYHMWYLQMIIALYMCLPIWRYIVINEKIYMYLLRFSLIVGIIFPTINEIPYINVFDNIYKNCHFAIGSEYLFYFLVGYYLSYKNISKKGKTIIWFCFPIALVSRIAITYFTSLSCDTLKYDFYDDNNILAIMQAISAFCFIKEYANFLKDKKVVRFISKYSFFIYMAHDLFLQILFLFGINASVINPIIMTPIIVAILIILCMCLGWLLSKWKFGRKYLI